jgi:hypothetical protein
MRCDWRSIAKGLILSWIIWGVLAFGQLGAASAWASTWTSPDGAIAVSRPDPLRFRDIETVPRNLAAWERTDKGLRLTVIKFPLPRGSALTRSAVEEIVQAEHARVTDLTVEQIRGHAVFRVSAQLHAAYKEIHSCQSIVAIDGAVYLAAAFSVGVDPLRDKDAREFLASFTILRDAFGPSAAGGSKNGAEIRGAILSSTGGAGVVGFGVFLFFLVVSNWATLNRLRLPGAWKLKLSAVGSAICFLLAAAGVLGNVTMLLRGQGLPEDPATRAGYMVGLFIPAVLLCGGGAALGLLVRRRIRAAPVAGSFAPEELVEIVPIVEITPLDNSGAAPGEVVAAADAPAQRRPARRTSARHAALGLPPLPVSLVILAILLMISIQVVAGISEMAQHANAAAIAGTSMRLLIFDGVGLLVAWGLFMGHRLAWQWARWLALLFLVVGIPSMAAFLSLGKHPEELPVWLPAVALLTLLVAAIFIGLGGRAARKHFRLICPRCGRATGRAADFVFAQARCKACGVLW